MTRSTPIPHFYNATDALAWFAWHQRFAKFKEARRELAEATPYAVVQPEVTYGARQPIQFVTQRSDRDEAAVKIDSPRRAHGEAHAVNLATLHRANELRREAHLANDCPILHAAADSEMRRLAAESVVALRKRVADRVIRETADALRAAGDDDGASEVLKGRFEP